MLRRLAPALIVLALLPACSEVRETAGRAGDCAGLVRDVAATGLSGTPSLEDAETAVGRLDDRLQDIDDEELAAATRTLRDRLQELVDAARTGDTGDAQAAADQAREAARETASLCGVPVDQVLGG